MPEPVSDTERESLGSVYGRGMVDIELARVALENVPFFLSTVKSYCSLELYCWVLSIQAKLRDGRWLI